MKTKISGLVGWILVIVLLFIAATFAQLSLFIPTLSYVVHMSMLVKLAMSLFLLMIEWVFIIPVIRIGLTFMNPIQITILAFLVTFIVQLVTNIYVFNNKNTIDDYVATILMTLGIIISKTNVFG